MIVFLILFLLLIISPVFAQTITGVSGTASNGQNITITGSNFGGGPNVLLFDDFEGGINGNQLATNLAPLGAWSAVQTPIRTSYSNANAISGSLGARFDSYDYPLNQHPVIHIDAPTGFNTFYISWWGLIPSGDRIPGCDGYGGCNWKTIWVSTNDGNVNDADVCIVSNGTSAWSIFGNDYPYEYSPYLKDSWDTNNDPAIGVPGVWHRFQFYLKGSSNHSVGQERIWLTTTSTRLVKNRNRQTLGTGDENKRRRFYVNGYVRDTPNSHPTFDDVYIAYGENAQARVEIGNANTYTGCSSLSMCTPTSWGSSSIVCTVRRGNLTEGYAWVYVTDAAGNRSPGYRITIDGTIAPPPGDLSTPAAFQLVQ
jgi:hypothetical protein